MRTGGARDDDHPHPTALQWVPQASANDDLWATLLANAAADTPLTDYPTDASVYSNVREGRMRAALVAERLTDE